MSGYQLMIAGDVFRGRYLSTWFPVIDLNPQRFVPNICLAKETDFQVATQRIYRSGRYASHIAVPVIVALPKK